jgi:hypothetical protein
MTSAEFRAPTRRKEPHSSLGLTGKQRRFGRLPRPFRLTTSGGRLLASEPDLTGTDAQRQEDGD